MFKVGQRYTYIADLHCFDDGDFIIAEILEDEVKIYHIDHPEHVFTLNENAVTCGAWVLKTKLHEVLK